MLYLIFPQFHSLKMISGDGGSILRYDSGDDVRNAGAVKIPGNAGWAKIPTPASDISPMGIGEGSTAAPPPNAPAPFDVDNCFIIPCT